MSLDRGFLFLCAALLACPALIPASEKPFLWFDAIGGYKGKEARARGLLRPLEVAYGRDLWAEPHKGPPKEPGVEDEKKIRAYAMAMANAAPGGRLCLDIEHLPLDGMNASYNREVLRKVIGWVRSEAPFLKLGLYSTIPIPWRRRVDNPPGKLIWDLQCKAARPVADALDFVAPSLYMTGDIGYEEWERRAKQVLEQARIYGKPVYGFVSPRRYSRKQSEPLTSHDWRRVLRFVRAHCDGAVIWAHGKGKEPWDERAEWWQEVLKAGSRDRQSEDTGFFVEKQVFTHLGPSPSLENP